MATQSSQIPSGEPTPSGNGYAGLPQASTVPAMPAPTTLWRWLDRLAPPVGGGPARSISGAVFHGGRASLHAQIPVSRVAATHVPPAAPPAPQEEDQAEDEEEKQYEKEFEGALEKLADKLTIEINQASNEIVRALELDLPGQLLELERVSNQIENLKKSGKTGTAEWEYYQKLLPSTQLQVKKTRAYVREREEKITQADERFQEEVERIQRDEIALAGLGFIAPTELINPQATTLEKVIDLLGSVMGGPTDKAKDAKKARKRLKALKRVLKRTGDFKSFTKNNYRESFIRFTTQVMKKKIPANADAHHVFPQAQRAYFHKKGINPDLPVFLVWAPRDAHRYGKRDKTGKKVHDLYNIEWQKWIDSPAGQNAGPAEILTKAAEMDKSYPELFTLDKPIFLGGK